jgi:hypothetical protein
MSIFLKIQSKCNNAVKFVPMPCPSHSSINCDQSKPKDNQNDIYWFYYIYSLYVEILEKKNSSAKLET